MKKHILPVLLTGALSAFAPSQLNAQIHNDRGTFNMPGRGDLLVETQANLDLTGGRIFNLNDGFLSNLNNGLDTAGVGVPQGFNNSYYPMLKVRKFVGNSTALRLFLNISYSTHKEKVGSVEQKASNFGVAAGAGIEKIFTPAERLNTYVGADLMVGFARVRVQADPSINTRQSGFGVGVRGFTGMDYYVLPKVYLGLELGWGLSYNGYGVIKYESGDNDATSSNFTLTPYVTPTFRLGYVLGAGRKMHGSGEPSYRSNSSSNDDE